MTKDKTLNTKKLQKKTKKIILYLEKNFYSNMNIISEKFSLNDKERTLIEETLARNIQPPLIKKFQILGITDKSIGSYTLSIEGKKLAKLYSPFYRNTEKLLTVSTIILTIATCLMAYFTYKLT